MRRFLAWVRQHRVVNPSREDVLRYKSFLDEEKLSPLTVTGYLVVVRKFFEWTESVRLYPNVARNIRGGKRRRGFHKDPLTTAQVKHGQRIYQQNNCMACHQFYGLGGYMGPDLTNVVSSKGAAYARAFLISGTERMPNFGFNDEEMDDLVAFLEFVDTMGTYQAPSYELSWYGTVVALDE